MGVVSALALFLLPPSNVSPLPQEPSTISFVQGNYILATNGIYTETQSYATLLGIKSPGCPLSCQCVAYVKSKIPIPLGNANQIPINSSTPVVGGAVLFYSNPWGHIAYVEQVFGDMIFISEQNQKGCCVISSRWISINSPSVKGYFVP